ncbi:MAG TPA: hypothetical protein VEU94_12235 [Terriglobales bacterium]|nr:hypothetical protein [Terriglobales bacterium]
MRTFLIAALAALSTSSVFAQSSADLVNLSAKDVPVENGKQLAMTFQEIKREPDASLVEITSSTSPTEASSMFILKGMCSIAQSRGQPYFRAVQIAKKPVRYSVTFPKEAGVPDPKPVSAMDKVFSLAECALLNF